LGRPFSSTWPGLQTRDWLQNRSTMPFSWLSAHSSNSRRPRPPQCAWRHLKPGRADPSPSCQTTVAPLGAVSSISVVCSSRHGQNIACFPSPTGLPEYPILEALCLQFPDGCSKSGGLSNFSPTESVGSKRKLQLQLCRDRQERHPETPNGNLGYIPFVLNLHSGEGCRSF
jgi:hypothetical protein